MRFANRSAARLHRSKWVQLWFVARCECTGPSVLPPEWPPRRGFAVVSRHAPGLPPHPPPPQPQVSDLQGGSEAGTRPPTVGKCLSTACPLLRAARPLGCELNPPPAKAGAFVGFFCPGQGNGRGGALLGNERPCDGAKWFAFVFVMAGA